MEYHLDVTKHENYLRIEFRGDLTAENQKQVIEDIYLALFNGGEKNALVDRRAGPLQETPLANYNEADFISDLPYIYRFRIAVLVRAEEIGHASFLEAVAVNRGVNWKFFDSEEDAIDWLSM